MLPLIENALAEMGLLETYQPHLNDPVWLAATAATDLDQDGAQETNLDELLGLLD